MSIRQWCRKIAQLPRGRVLLRNLLYDLDRGRIAEELVEPLLDYLARHGDDALTPEEAADLVDAFRGDGGPERTCAGRGGPRTPAACSRVLDEGSCLLFNIDAAHYGLPLEDEAPSWFFERLAARPLDAGGVRGQMTTGRGYVWVTRRQDLEALDALESGASRADRARRHLGLEHLGDGMRLLAIHYPDDLPWSTRHAPPTTLEGGANVVYRSREGGDGWGRAVDLETLEDGLPELVHGPVDFSDRFEIEVLGPLAGARARTPETVADATAPIAEGWLERAIVKLLDHAGTATEEGLDDGTAHAER